MLMQFFFLIASFVQKVHWNKVGGWKRGLLPEVESVTNGAKLYSLFTYMMFCKFAKQQMDKFEL